MQILVVFGLFRSFLPAIWLTGSFYVAPALMPCYIYLFFQRAWKIIGTFITPSPWNTICHVVKVYLRYMSNSWVQRIQLKCGISIKADRSSYQLLGLNLLTLNWILTKKLLPKGIMAVFTSLLNSTQANEQTQNKLSNDLSRWVRQYQDSESHAPPQVTTITLPLLTEKYKLIVTCQNTQPNNIIYILLS